MSSNLDEAIQDNSTLTSSEVVTNSVPVRRVQSATMQQSVIEKKLVDDVLVESGTMTISPMPLVNTPARLVLQWLTYAFWGWGAFSLLWLVAMMFGFWVAGADSTAEWGDMLPYPLASVVVFLLISLMTDYFYSRYEPVHKTRAASVIMLIHAVLYTLAGVGALVAAVFMVIYMTLNSTSTDSLEGPKVALYTALVMTVVFAALVVRIVFAGRMRHLRKIFWVVMSVVSLIFIIAGIAGPAAQAALTKQDRLIEEALPTLVGNINTYVSNNDKLPETLRDVEYSKYDSYSSGKVQKMIADRLVRYTPNTKPATNGATGVTDLQTKLDKNLSAKKITVQPTTPKTYYYKLCVDYRVEKKSTGTYRESSGVSYDSYGRSYGGIDTSQHKQGEVCYDLSASGKYVDNPADSI